MMALIDKEKKRMLEQWPADSSTSFDLLQAIWFEGSDCELHCRNKDGRLLMNQLVECGGRE